MVFISAPFAAFILIYTLYSRNLNRGWRGPLLYAALAWGSVLTAITEGLSLLNLFTFGWILGLWLICAAIALVLLRTTDRWSPERIDIEPLGPILRSLLVGVGLTAATLGLIALIVPPSTGDSMAYHLSRVAHWIQNQSVDFYPTHIERQLTSNPWAEYAIAHLKILGAGDRFVNLVQWFSMLGSLLGVSLIAERLGADRRGQVFAAVIAVAIPMGILQATSTQNDYVFTFWFVCLVYFGMLFREQPNLHNSLLIGAALGLAILTKGTAYIFLPPFLVWIFAGAIKRRGFEFWKPILAIAAVSLALNAGHYARNVEMYGSLLAPLRHNSYGNEAHTMPIFISNVIRNIGLHAGTPIKPLNVAFETGIRRTHDLIGMDINDTRNTWITSYPYVIYFQESYNNEDRAGNPWHLLLIFAAIGAFLASKRLRSSPGLPTYALLLIASFLLHSLLLKWQPWHSRLVLPIFVLWAPFIAIVLSRIKFRRVASSLMVLTLVLAVPWIVNNETRNLIGTENIFRVSRTDQYFRKGQHLQERFAGAVDFITAQGCADVGLFIGKSEFEYPLWVLFGDKQQNFKLKHVGVWNTSKILSDRQSDFDPCAVIITNIDQSENFVAEQTGLTKGWESTGIEVLIRN